MVANVLPYRWWVQLLLSTGCEGLKQGGDTYEHCLSLFEMGMHARQRGRRLSRMFGSATHRGHQPRAAGNRSGNQSASYFRNLSS